MNTLYLIRLAGLTQFAILTASALVPRVLDWRRAFAPLHPFLRQLFWVYGVFIVFVIISFGTLTLVNARAIAAGDPVARSLCAFIAFFWLARLATQLFVFDCRDFLTTPFLKLGYHALTLAFVGLTLVYGCAALCPEWLHYL